jgi:hypothetical protein
MLGILLFIWEKIFFSNIVNVLKLMYIYLYTVYK